jgi:hypothetical protein
MKSEVLFAAVGILCIAGCASQETTYWTREKDLVVVHHIRRTQDGLEDRAEKLLVAKLPAEKVKLLALNKEDRYYQVAQSASLVHPRNPETKSHKVGINDAVAEAEDAKTKLDAARRTLEEQMASDKELREQLKQVLAENQRLQNPNSVPATAATGEQPVRLSQ